MGDDDFVPLRNGHGVGNLRPPRVDLPSKPLCRGNGVAKHDDAGHVSEGGIRDWSIATTRFTGSTDGRVTQLHAVRVGAAPRFEPIPGTEFSLDADLVLIAMGFLGPVRNGMIEQLGVDLDPRGNVATDANHMSSVPGIFAAGDMRRGQSLVVWAIAEGRKTAAAVDSYLKMGAAQSRAAAIPPAAQAIA